MNTVDTLVARAKDRTGLDDFGSASFREAIEALVDGASTVGPSRAPTRRTTRSGLPSTNSVRWISTVTDRASFESESKWDGLDEFSRQQYDHDTDSIVVVGELIIVDR